MPTGEYFSLSIIVQIYHQLSVTNNLPCRTVVVWGVTLPPIDYAGKEGAACGNSWIPLQALKLGGSPVTIVAYFADLGYLAAGDNGGEIVIWSATVPGAPERFRADLSGEHITAIEVAELAIFVGTKSGSVYACSGPDDPNLIAIPAIAKLSGDLGSVTHLLLAPYWRSGCGNLNITAVYVSFSNGYVAVINAYTRELLCFAKSSIQTTTATGIQEGDANALPCLKFDDIGRGYYPVRFSAVLTSKYELARNELKEIDVRVDDDVSSADQSASTSPIAKDSEVAEKRSSWLGSKIANRGSVGKLGSPITERRPADAAKYFLQVCNTSVVIFDLSAIVSPVAAGSNISKVKDSSIQAQENISSRVYEFCDPIVAANGVTYIEDAARFWASPFLSLSCVDTLSNITQLSFSAHELNCMCEVNLLEKVSVEVSLMDSVVLQNGNVYMLHNDSCIFSASPADKKYVPVLPAPVRSRTDCVPPHPTQLLLTGIEDGTLSLSKAGGAVGAPAQEIKVKKRRSSIMDMVSSSPVELDKLFLKTRTELQKVELMAKENGDNDSFDSDALVQRHNAKAAIAQTQRVNSNVMNETRQAFEERGEKLSRVAKRSQELSDRSQEYKQNVHAHKERLRKKATRWGLF